MKTLNEQDLSRAIREVIKLSLIDPDFRAQAVANPSEAISTVAGAKVTANVRFVDDFGTGSRTIVLADPVANGAQLSEEELEQVAGGCWVGTCDVSCNHTGVAED